MARHWQILFLAGALLAPTGAWADKKDGDKQRSGRSERDRDWDENDRGRNRVGGVWDAVTGRNNYPRDTESDKDARKGQKERDKDQREALKERDKDRREGLRESDKDRQEAARESDKDRQEAARESDKDRREAVRESEKDRAAAARNGGRNSDYPRTRTRVPFPIP